MSVFFKLSETEEMNEQDANFIRSSVNQHGLIQVLGVLLSEVGSISEQAQDEGEPYTVTICDLITHRIENAVEARRLLSPPVKTAMEF